MSAKLRRRRTENIERHDVEFMVMQYACLDNAVVQALGKSSLLWQWLVSVGGGSTLDLRLTVDTHIMGRPEVGLMLGSENIFPGSGRERGKLKEDLKWQCPFRGIVAGVGELRRYELKPEHSGMDLWYPATITRQREDGLFEVTAALPGEGEEGEKEVAFPAVRQEALREAESKMAVRPELRSLVLSVPCKDPKNSTLSVESSSGSTLITHFFARRTPPVVKDSSCSLANARYVPPRILFSMSENRSTLTCSVGHSTLEHFLSGQVRSLEQSLSGHRATWQVQIGPFAVHTIEVERRYLLSSVVTLSVDGDRLCEAAADDLECPSETWECTFRLLGEKFIDWNVYEQTPAGVVLGTRGKVNRRTPYSHKCVVNFPTTSGIDMNLARLTIDSVDFNDMPPARKVSQEPKLSVGKEGWPISRLQHRSYRRAKALLGSYNLEVPVKYNTNPPGCLDSFISRMGISCGTSTNLFCCGNTLGQHVQNDTVVAPTRMDVDAPGILDPKLIYPILGDLDADEDEPSPQMALDAEAPGKAAPSPFRSSPEALQDQKAEPAGGDKPRQEAQPNTSPDTKGANANNQDPRKDKRCCVVQ